MKRQVRTGLFKPLPAGRVSYLDQHQLRMGMRVEMEHTYNPRVAFVIAAHHLLEFPDYYSRLVKMERQARKYWRGR